MRKLLLLLLLLLPVSGVAQVPVSWRIRTLNGAVSVQDPTVINVTNGTLSCIGKICTLTIGGGGGSGSVTTFSSGNLSPLFTTSVATATTTPALSFSLSMAGAHKFFGNNTGSTTAPDYVSIVAADLPNTAVSAGSYTLASITVDAQGRLINASSGTAQGNPTPAYATLTDGAIVTWTFTIPQYIQNATVTLGGNRTLAIAGAISGTTGVLKVVQDGTGSRTLTLPAGSKVINGGGGAVTLSTAASSTDILTFTFDGTNYFWTIGNGYN